jgi:hypothetical protein
MEIGEDDTQSIEHIKDVLLSNNGYRSYVKDIVHVPRITKNLVSVG